MSGLPESRSNTYGRSNHVHNVSLPPRASGWTQCSGPSDANNLKGSRVRNPSGSDFSSCSSHSEPSLSVTSPRLPKGRVCMGRPYNSKFVETSHLVKGSKVARKSSYQPSYNSPNCLLCSDRPLGPSSPSFLDQLIKGINYLDRSTSAFYNNCPKTLSLPRLAANYLERAANSLYLDHLERTAPRSYSTPGSSTLAPDSSNNTTCVVSSTRGAGELQCLGGSTTQSCQHQHHGQNFTSLRQRPGIKLPELPLFGNGLFSLDRLPKFWEAIRSGWNAPEPVSKPSNWW
ncbi:hypothetical protein SUZIE_166185 [Sciurus carolinensis]|uniref:Uncharacterized protein n=1 Tax=Sciurus carolinensis TaxID=30640 RepID=A0AA41SYR9_SCICA|nr:uncharacterized protein LOC124958630 [Sciurus carolinensis]MBZ3882088.1 hypothetical protein [Sciurus carolinensis]